MQPAIPSAILNQLFGVDSLDQLPDDTRKSLVRQVTEPLWRSGNLRYKLHDVHLRIDATFNKAPGRRRYLNCHRRFGKSWYLFVRAVEVCLRQPNARVLYLAPSGKDARQISTDTSIEVFADCPDDLKPDFAYQHNEFKFKNGSIIRVRGVNAEHADSLRGGSAHLVVLDEAGQMDNLGYILRSVVGPMTMTTDGEIILATTPPTTPGHDSAAMFNELADLGATFTATIREHVPHIPRHKKIEMLRELGEKPENLEDIMEGRREPDTTAAQRELFCKFVTDANLAVVPEYPAYRGEIIREHPRPSHFDAYTAIDPGSKDNTGILYGYVDFLKHALVVEDEHLLQNPTTTKIAQTIKESEENLWVHQEPYRRVSDVDLRLIQDLRAEHGLTISPVRKGAGSLMAGVHQLRHLVTAKRIIISPKCVHLDRQLQNAIWNKRATDMDRAGEGSMDGHFDLVAALLYLIRAVDWHHNPYPHNWSEVGMPHGPPAGSWVSPRARTSGPKSVGLLGSTPTAKRIIAAAKKKRRRWV